MDPDQTLADLRDALKELSTIPVNDPREPAISAQVMERFGALDDWLSRGGYLPVDWQRHQPSADWLRGAAQRQS